MKYLSLIVCVLCLWLLVGCGTPITGQNDTVAQAAATQTPLPTAPAAQRTTYTVQRGDVLEEFTFRGRWLPRDQVQLSFEVGGNVRAVDVQAGDTVVAGDVMADLQIDDLEDRLETELLDLAAAQRELQAGTEDSGSVVDATFSLANANLTLDSEVAGAPWTAIADARDNLTDAERELTNAQLDYDDAVSRPDSTASTTNSAWERLQDAEDAVDAAERALYDAQVRYYQYSIGVQQQENAVTQAELALDDAASTGGDPDLVDAVIRAQIAVDNTREEITQSTLIAPIDGVVLEVTIQPGDAVDAFVGVITLALPEPLEIISNLSFNETQFLQVGQLGTCQEANNDTLIVQCAIRRIPLTANEVDQTTRVAATLPELQSGALIDVTMILQESLDTLFLPPQAINEFGNRTFVVLQTETGESVRDVVLGLRTETQVEITEGLSEGDIVVQQ